jgi:hypothetical protein
MHRTSAAVLVGALGLVAGACAPPVRTAPTPDARTSRLSAPRFYHGLTYGTEAQFNPLSEIVNEGFDILSTRGENRHVLSRNYGGAFGNVWRSLSHVDATYRAYGWRNAVRNELAPFSHRDGRGGGAWVANYEMHLLGSGMVSVRMEEWFAAHGATHPTALAVATLSAAHLLNEVVENGPTRTLNEDATTDLLIFDPLGLALWRVDAVQRLFSGPLELTNWPGQPSLDLPSKTLQNAGQQFVIRVPLPRTTHWKLLYDFGMTSLGGVSYSQPSGSAWSVALGADVIANPVVDSTTGAKTALFKFKGGVFYDRNGSLLFSLLASSRKDVGGVTANIYPGGMRIGSWHPGLWVQLPGSGGVRIGIASRWGIGLGTGPER